MTTTTRPSIAALHTTALWLIDSHALHHDRCRAVRAGVDCKRCDDLLRDVLAAERELKDAVQAERRTVTA